MDDFVIGNFSSYGDTFVSKPSYNVKIRYDLFNLIPKNHQINTILEIGCADGNNLIYLKNKYNLNNQNVIGVDNCKISSNKKNNEFKFIHQNAENFIENHNKRYDLIVLSDVIEHIYNPWKILQNIKNILNKKGIVLLSIPNLQNIKYINAITSGNFFYEKTGLFDETHIRFFTMNTIIKYLKSLAFKIVSTDWREDKTLNNIKKILLKELTNKEHVYLKLENMNLKIFKKNVDNFLSQQILICISNA